MRRLTSVPNPYWRVFSSASQFTQSFNVVAHGLDYSWLRPLYPVFLGYADAQAFDRAIQCRAEVWYWIGRAGRVSWIMACNRLQDQSGVARVACKRADLIER